jgi:hypothetical protein
MIRVCAHVVGLFLIVAIVICLAGIVVMRVPTLFY